MALSDPSVGACLFVIGTNSTQYDAFFDVKEIGDSFYGQVRYRPLNSAPTVPWVFLSPSAGSSPNDSQFDLKRMTTKETTDAEIDSVLDNANRSIKEVFGDSGGSAPESGIERVRWLLKNNMFTEKNNVLSRLDSE